MSDDAGVPSGIIGRELAGRERGTAAAMAVAVGVTQETVSKWSKGTTEPTPDKYPAIEEFLGLPAGTLRMAAGLTPEGETALSEWMTGIEERLESLELALRTVLETIRSASDGP